MGWECRLAAVVRVLLVSCWLGACGGESDHAGTAGQGGAGSAAVGGDHNPTNNHNSAGQSGATVVSYTAGTGSMTGPAGRNGGSAGKSASNPGGSGAAATSAGAAGGGGSAVLPTDDLPAPGNADGHCALPADAALEDVSKPTTVVGTGTPAGCTGDAFVSAVAKGGIITFNCGANPLTITLTQTAKVFNDKGPKIVIDGGGKVTLSGADKVRILYQDTCDKAQTWTSAQCDNQPYPALTVQNITFVHGSAKNMETDGGGGGAIFARGGRFKAINARFFNNTCDLTGPDVGGAAIRTLDQSMGKPVYIVNSTFGGRTDLGNIGSNGAGLSSIGVSYTVLNSLFSYNQAVGNGANPADPGTPGGGSGGAIYNDGNTYTLTVCGTRIENNTANEGGGAIFYVSNDSTGTLTITDSILRGNPSKKFETDGYPGIFEQGTKSKPTVTGSTLTK